VRLSTVGDDEDNDDEEAPETKPATESRRVAPPWAVVDSDRSFVGNGKPLWLMHLFSSGITTVLFGTVKKLKTRMWANAQPDGRPAEHRWRPLFNAAKFG